jgi:S-formylglutathione hydrolase FrmB
VITLLAGFTGTGEGFLNRTPWAETLPERVDRLIRTGAMREAIVVMPDGFTRYGGSQYLNSSATGRYEDHLVRELVPWVDARFRTIPDPGARALVGKSSGGYGALVTPMLRPDLFSALASHAGDALFEACYLPEFRESARALRDEYGGSFERFWEDVRSRPFGTKQHDGVLLNSWCMAACYSADPDGTVVLPFDIETGKLINDVWERWLVWDPVRMVPRHADALRSMRAIWVDAGKKDEYYLDDGAVAVSKELSAIGAEHTLELFDAGHMSIGYRYPRALAFLAKALAA